MLHILFLQVRIFLIISAPKRDSETTDVTQTLKYRNDIATIYKTNN